MKKPENIADLFRELEMLRIRVNKAEVAAARKAGNNDKSKDNRSRLKKTDSPRTSQ